MTLAAKFISPQQVYGDPKLWLSIPHELHESLLKLMKMMFPDFESRIEHIHCLECEGNKPFEVITRDTFEERLVTGYVCSSDGKIDLLRTTGIKEAK